MLYILWTKAFWRLGKQNVRSLQFSLWESFEGIYVDVSMGCSHPGTHRTLWWDELELRRSYNGNLPPLSSRLDASRLFLLCAQGQNPKRKSATASFDYSLITGRDYPSPYFSNVWYGIPISWLVASVWPLKVTPTNAWELTRWRHRMPETGDKYKYRYIYKYK